MSSGEFRWLLLFFGVLVLLGIYLHGRWQIRQRGSQGTRREGAPAGAAQRREPTVAPPEAGEESVEDVPEEITGAAQVTTEPEPGGDAAGGDQVAMVERLASVDREAVDEEAVAAAERAVAARLKFWDGVKLAMDRRQHPPQAPEGAGGPG